jgi:hypothetical protein
MSATAVPGRFTTLPDDSTLQATVVALEEHGFSAEVVDDLDAARAAVLARIPDCCSSGTRRSTTATCAGTLPSSAWTSRPSTATGTADRIRRDVDSGLASGQALTTPTLFIDGVVHRGGYDPPTLLAALAP